MKKRIVAVEDDPLYSELIRKMHAEIEKQLFGDAELIVISTISMLRHILATNGVSIVVLDLTLVDSNQEETIEMVSRERNSLPPIFAITGDELLSTRERCISAGFCGFALKRHVNVSPNFFFAELLNAYLRCNHG